MGGSACRMSAGEDHAMRAVLPPPSGPPRPRPRPRLTSTLRVHGKRATQIACLAQPTSQSAYETMPARPEHLIFSIIDSVSSASAYTTETVCDFRDIRSTVHVVPFVCCGWLVGWLNGG